jgi:hypothetical protein
MEARLFELIRDYQADRATIVGGLTLEFRVDALERFATARPDRYPEYVVDTARLNRAVLLARESGEILPPPTGSRDVHLMLRWDRDRGT